MNTIQEWLDDVPATQESDPDGNALLQLANEVEWPLIVRTLEPMQG